MYLDILNMERDTKAGEDQEKAAKDTKKEDNAEPENVKKKQKLADSENPEKEDKDAKPKTPPPPVIDVTKKRSVGFNPYFPNLFTTAMNVEDKEVVQKKRVDGITNKWLNLGEGGVHGLKIWAEEVLDASLRKKACQYTSVFLDVVNLNTEQEKIIQDFLKSDETGRAKAFLLGKGVWGLRYTDFLKKVSSKCVSEDLGSRRASWLPPERPCLAFGPHAWAADPRPGYSTDIRGGTASPLQPTRPPMLATCPMLCVFRSLLPPRIVRSWAVRQLRWFRQDRL
jgi:hypothetical protein